MKIEHEKYKIIYTKKLEQIIVDSDDYEILNARSWYLDKDGYACAGTHKDGKKLHFKMHRVIMNAKKGDFVDHINGIRSDNRRKNLRLCTVAENSYNKKAFASKSKKSAYHSRFKGVAKFSDNNYKVYISKNENSKKYIGTYSNEIAAANAYNRKAKELFGVFAKLNECEHMCDEEINKHVIKQSSQFKGVSYHIRLKKWAATIYHGDKKIHVGYYDEELEAKKAYDDKKIELEGVDISCQV